MGVYKGGNCTKADLRLSTPKIESQARKDRSTSLTRGRRNGPKRSASLQTYDEAKELKSKVARLTMR